MKTYLFYDIETSGLNPAFDQILTFACIRCDLSLNEIDRQTITIALRKDIVPSPGAFLTHGLTPDDLAFGISEYNAARKIHQLLNSPDTISLGYNSLGFDDEFLRFTFYRNLLDPYTHQYANGCCRMDILPVTLVFRVFHPQGLKWPEVDGKPSLKLDLIAQENQFVTSGRAHEAMSDVEAVIALSKKMFFQKEIWKYCLGFFNKTGDEVRIAGIKKEFTLLNRQFTICLMMSTRFGSAVNYLAPVMHLGQSSVYKNQSLWLRLDSDDISGLDDTVDLNDTFVIRKRPADALIVLPALERFWDKLPESSQHLAKENRERIRLHSERFFKFIQYHIEFKYPIIPNIDADAALYQDGFFSRQEKKEIQHFHSTPDDKKQDVLNQIQSPRLKILARRIFLRNFEDTVDEFYMDRLRSSLKKDEIIGYKNDTKFNRQQGLEELKEINQTLLNPTGGQRRLLDWLQTYIETL